MKLSVRLAYSRPLTPLPNFPRKILDFVGQRERQGVKHGKSVNKQDDKSLAKS